MGNRSIIDGSNSDIGMGSVGGKISVIPGLHRNIAGRGVWGFRTVLKCYAANQGGIGS